MNFPQTTQPPLWWLCRLHEMKLLCYRAATAVQPLTEHVVARFPAEQAVRQALNDQFEAPALVGFSYIQPEPTILGHVSVIPLAAGQTTPPPVPAVGF